MPPPPPAFTPRRHLAAVHVSWGYRHRCHSAGTAPATFHHSQVFATSVPPGVLLRAATRMSLCLPPSVASNSRYAFRRHRPLAVTAHAAFRRQLQRHVMFRHASRCPPSARHREHCRRPYRHAFATPRTALIFTVAVARLEGALCCALRGGARWRVEAVRWMIGRQSRSSRRGRRYAAGMIQTAVRPTDVSARYA